MLLSSNGIPIALKQKEAAVQHCKNSYVNLYWLPAARVEGTASKRSASKDTLSSVTMSFSEHLLTICKHLIFFMKIYEWHPAEGK